MREIKVNPPSLQVMPITLNPNIRSLILKYNQFKTVDASISFYPSLVTLDISSNRLETLPDKVFINQHMLDDLNLSDNNINEVKDEVFTGLTRLTKLKMSKNKVNLLQNRSFQSLQNLEFLDLSENKITSIDDESFKTII